MLIKNLKGEEFVIETDITVNKELNGNQALRATIYDTPTNRAFIKNVTVNWVLIDNDRTEYTILHVKHSPTSDHFKVEITAVPNFFDVLDTNRIYDEYNTRLSAHDCFMLILEDTGYRLNLTDNFDTLDWEGLGAGETKLESFKRALNRYGAEFNLKGDTVNIRRLVGRDTHFIYHHKLNMDNFELESDGTEMYTFAKGYGDYTDEEGWENAKLTSTYTSPLAIIAGIGIRHAPPLKDGRIKVKKTMDEKLKALVDESLKVSITVDIHDLRSQGFETSQLEVGDRVKVFDATSDSYLDVRIVELEITKNYKGEIVDCELTLGTPNTLKRYQSNLDTALKEVSDFVTGKKTLPYSALDEAVKRSTEALRSAQSELEFENGIIARDKNNPNRLVLFNSSGIGISDDGGITFKEAITADGFNLSAGVIGKLDANSININPDTNFRDRGNLISPNDNWDELTSPGDYAVSYTSQNAAQVQGFPSGAWSNGLLQVNSAGGDRYTQRYIMNSSLRSSYQRFGVLQSNGTVRWSSWVREETASEAQQKIDSSDKTLRDNLQLKSPLPTSIRMDSSGITAQTSSSTAYARLDYRGLYIRGGAIQIDGGLDDSQIKGSTKWNRQGTYIDSNGIYTGRISANQVQVGFNGVSSNVQITSSGLETRDGSTLTSRLTRYGHDFYNEGVLTGSIGTKRLSTSSSSRGLSFSLENGAEYMGWSHRTNASDSEYSLKLAWYKTSYYNDHGYRGFVFTDDITLFQSHTLKLRKLSTVNYTNGERLVELQNRNWHSTMGVSLRYGTSGAGLYVAQGMAALLCGNAHLEVVQDGTGNAIRSTDIYNRRYTSSTNTVGIGTDGVLGRISSSRRYKLLEEPVGLDYAKRILQIDAKSWYDKQACEDYANTLADGVETGKQPINRIIGLIAEDMDEADLDLLVHYDEDGKPEGIASNTWALFIPLIKDLYSKIDELERKINNDES